MRFRRRKLLPRFAAVTDLLFLDVQMPECDGFDVLELLGSDIPPAVVLVTAYDRYALRAFEAGALDYLLKPFDDARFRWPPARQRENRPPAARAETQCSRHHQKPGTGHLPQRLGNRLDRSCRLLCLPPCGVQDHLLRRSLLDFERDLDSARFCRIHRSSILNLDRVRTLQFDQSGDYEVLLHDGTKLRLGRRYYQTFLSRMSARGIDSHPHAL